MLLTSRKDVQLALESAKRVYADAKCLVDVVREAVPGAMIRTYPPAVSALKACDILSEDHIRQTETANANLGERIRKKYWNAMPDLSTALVNESYDRLHRLLYKAICLEDSDYSEKTVLLQPNDPHDPVFNDTFASPLERIFESCQNIKVVRLDRSLLPATTDPRPPNPQILTRVAFPSTQSIIFRLLQMFWERSGVRPP